MGFCNDITPTCDVCFEVLYGECNDVLTISLGLTPSTTFFLNLTDKFDIVTPLTVTTDGSGDFTITQTWTEFFGVVELEIFSDSGRTLIATFVQDSTVYNCVLLVQELSGSNNITPPSVFSNQFSILSDGTSNINIDGIGSSLATRIEGVGSVWSRGASGNADGRIIAVGEDKVNTRIDIQRFKSGKVSVTGIIAGTLQWVLDTAYGELIDGTFSNFIVNVDAIEAEILINNVKVP